MQVIRLIASERLAAAFAWTRHSRRDSVGSCCGRGPRAPTDRPLPPASPSDARVVSASRVRPLIVPSRR